MADGKDNRAESAEDLLKSSELLFQQTEYLLNDEIKYADSLRETRRTLSALLAIVFGVGIFRISLFGTGRDQTLLVPTWVFVIIAVLMTLAILLVFYGAWLLYSERPLLIFYKARTAGDDAKHALEMGKRSAALAVLDFERRYMKTLEQAGPLFVVRVKTLALKLAYTRLAEANRRVRYRIDIGKKAIFVGLGMISLGFILYLWAIGLTAQVTAP